MTDIGDILEYYNLANENIPKLNESVDVENLAGKMSLAPLEKMVYSCLQIEPKYLDDIIYEVKTAPQEVCKALNHLVMLGIIIETTRNYYGIKIG